VHYCCITPERERKTRMMMEALAAGFGDEPHCIVHGEPPEDEHPFIVWGQEWLTLRTVPQAVKQRRPWWHLDNGYWNPARGGNRGYYRMTYRSLSPVLLPRSDDLRIAQVPLKPWNKNGGHVLFGYPGVHFGMALDLDVKGWCDRVFPEIYERTQKLGRELRVRTRDTTRPLADDLKDCLALVTHSSNVAVDAVIAGVPVFVQPTSPAAPVGRLDFDFANPVTPPRKWWLRSLASQHFSLGEMRQGIAWHWMQRIAAEVDRRKFIT
jgi:hypothetical protein